MTCKLCADHEEHGTLKERERIIKLLEEKYIELDCDHDGAWWCHAEDEISKLITLIKGKNNV